MPTASQVLSIYAVNITCMHNTCREMPSLVQGMFEVPEGCRCLLSNSKHEPRAQKRWLHPCTGSPLIIVIVTVRVGVVDDRGHIYREKEKRVGTHIYRSSEEQRKPQSHREKEKSRVLSQKTRGESFRKDGGR